jgi:hypothetical protein
MRLIFGVTVTRAPAPCWDLMMRSESNARFRCRVAFSIATVHTRTQLILPFFFVIP